MSTAWLAKALEVLPANYTARRRGRQLPAAGEGLTAAPTPRREAKFDKVLYRRAPPRPNRADGAHWLRRLKQAALMDEAGPWRWTER